LAPITASPLIPDEHGADDEVIPSLHRELEIVRLRQRATPARLDAEATEHAPGVVYLPYLLRSIASRFAIATGRRGRYVALCHRGCECGELRPRVGIRDRDRQRRTDSCAGAT